MFVCVVVLEFFDVLVCGCGNIFVFEVVVDVGVGDVECFFVG